MFSGHCRRKWTRLHELKTWTKLFGKGIDGTILPPNRSK